MNTHKLHIYLQYITAILVIASLIGTIVDFSFITYLYLATLVFTLNHLFVGLESIILDYVHNKMSVTSFLILIRICSISIIFITLILMVN